MKARTTFLVAFAVTVYVAVFGIPWKADAQTTLYQPSIYQSSSTVVGWTAGTLNNGGHAVTVTAGTASVTLSKADCSTPAYAGCNFLYANSAGTVAVSTSTTAAMLAGNSLMAYIETSGSAITGITFPNQNSPSFTSGIQSFFDCKNSSSCAGVAPSDPATVAGATIKVAAGSATLVAGTVTVSGITPAFTRNPTTNGWNYGCTVALNATTSTAAAQSMTITPVSTSSFTVVVGASASATDVIRWQCIGY